MDYSNSALITTIITAIFIGAATGYLGSFMILRRMSLVGDALSHVALPGLAVAIMLRINPFIGALSALLLAVLGIWYLDKHSSAPTETLVGIFFTASLSAGILITQEIDLLESLFGDITKVTTTDMAVAIMLSLAIVAMVYKISKALLLSTISNDLALSAGVKTSRINLIFLLSVGLAVALGIKIAGALLTGALVIIPAAAAKNISADFKQFSILSLIFGSAVGAVGVALAYAWKQPSGPIIVLIGTALFIITFIFRRQQV